MQRKKSALRRGFIVLVVLFVLVSAQPFSFTSPVVAQEPDDVPTSGSALSKDAGLFRTHVTFQDVVTQAKLKDYGVSKTGAPTPTFTPTSTCTPTPMPTPTPTPTSIPASTPTPTPTSTLTSTSTPECASPTPSATIIAMPDLVVQSMDAQPEFLKINQPVTITVTLRNQGNGELDRFFNTVLYVDHVPMGCNDVGAAYVRTNALGVDEVIALVFTYAGFNVAGTHTIFVQVDSSCQIQEANDNNNVYGPLRLRSDPYYVYLPLVVRGF